MTTRELRRKYLEFFDSKGHTRFPSGSLIPYDVTGRLDESLLFNGAGMVQFKPYFRGTAQPENRRLTTAQKCVRTGDIEEVGDTSHLTFFEMLGNFSFGDYFKAEAIDYSWEFLTDPAWLGLDPNRLAVTVFLEDDTAEAEWSKHFVQRGLTPEYRIFRLDEATNYWPAGAFSSGPPGPCGPNSEMFYWVSNETPPPTGAYTREDFVRDEAAGKWLEIWNDVFIQYDWQGVLKNPDQPSLGYAKTGMPNLPFNGIDTGMGLERTAAVLAGFSSVYETDVLRGIISRIETLSGTTPYGQSPELDRSYRIIADHIRTACFCIADGILPANNGRGYVLRRLIRRAVLKGQRTLGFTQPFFSEVFQGLLDTMGDFYTELSEREDIIRQTLLNEEDLFRRTIRQGTEMLTQALDQMKATGVTILEGEHAFKLYDTFGFPLEVTEEICREYGLSVDQQGYEVAMQSAQERSRGASGMEDVYGAEGHHSHFDASAPPTVFVGYDWPTAEARVVAAVPELDQNGLSTGRVAIALDHTPFYAESGGQVSDTGRLAGPGFELEVLDLIKQEGVYVHIAQFLSSSHPEPLEGMPGSDIQNVLNLQVFNQLVSAEIDADRRRQITRNHTATHLLQAAMRTLLGKHITQAGSYVGPNLLRFDFTHNHALTPDEIEAVENHVNAAILSGLPLMVHKQVPIHVAKAMGAMALFSEKYGDTVRVVEVSSDAGPVSIELCGGCHVQNTGQIGLFKILRESAVGSGIRRIEAITGAAVLAHIRAQHTLIQEAAGLLKSNEHDLVRAVQKNLELLKEERRKVQKLAMASATGADSQKLAVGPLTLEIRTLEGMTPKEAHGVIDQMVDNDRAKVAVVAVQNEGKVTLLAKCHADALQTGVHCGNLVKALAQIMGGNGGGHPDFATAGGKDPSKLSEALESAPKLLAEMVGA